MVDTVKGDSFQNFIAGGWDLCQGNKLGMGFNLLFPFSQSYIP